MAMKRYSMSLGRTIDYPHPAPERTAQRQARLFADVQFQVWPNRESLARSIRMQERRAPRPDDWRPLVPLHTTEGY